MKKGLDIWYRKGAADWEKVKAAGIDFIIPRDGWGTENIDPMLAEYAKGAKKAGIEVPGVFHFVYGINEKEAIANAQKAVENVKTAGLPKTTIIWCDIEDDTVFDARDYRNTILTAEMQKKMAIAFCDYVLAQGYCTGIYLNRYYYDCIYGPEIAKKYDIWIVDLEGEAYCKCVFRQHDWHGRVKGIDAEVDLDEYYGQYTAGTAKPKKEDKKMTRSDIIEAYCKEAIKLAADDSHGYSNVVGDNLGNLGDYDCGGFVSEALHRAGVLAANQWFEPNERYGNPWSYGTVLEPAGFERINFEKSKVQRGDILIKDGHHTELALGNGRQIGAHSNYDGVRGDYNHMGEISEVALSGYWDYIYRLKEEKKEEPKVEKSPFKDMKTTDKYYKQVKACYDAGIINTDAKGRIKPSRKITLLRLCIYMYRILKKVGAI